MKVKSLLAMTLTVSLTGCASLTTGTHQSLSVETVPLEHAQCKLSSDEGTWFVQDTPGTVMVSRGYGDLTVSCHEDTYLGTTTVKSTTKGITFGNILLGGGIGAAVDVGTGAAYDYPSLITVMMKVQSNS